MENRTLSVNGDVNERSSRELTRFTRRGQLSSSTRRFRRRGLAWVEFLSYLYERGGVEGEHYAVVARGGEGGYSIDTVKRRTVGRTWKLSIRSILRHATTIVFVDIYVLLVSTKTHVRRMSGGRRYG